MIAYIGITCLSARVLLSELRATNATPHPDHGQGVGVHIQRASGWVICKGASAVSTTVPACLPYAPLRHRANRPQLQRDPLGSDTEVLVVSTTTYAVALLAAAAICSLATVLAARRGSRSLAFVAVLASACLLALGWYDWRAQPSIETDIKTYVLIGTCPVAVTAFAIAIFRRREARTIIQWAVGAGAFCASTVAVLFLGLLFNWITI